MLANEVMNLLKGSVGVSSYSQVYASVHKSVTDRKAERKRKLAQLVISLSPRIYCIPPSQDVSLPSLHCSAYL